MRSAFGRFQNPPCAFPNLKPFSAPYGVEDQISNSEEEMYLKRKIIFTLTAGLLFTYVIRNGWASPSAIPDTSHNSSVQRADGGHPPPPLPPGPPSLAV
jgi:hypothetical protein